MKRLRRRMPWARILGMLAAVGVTLLCVASGIEPIEIVRRAGMSFVIVAVCTYVVTSLLQALENRPSRSLR